MPTIKIDQCLPSREDYAEAGVPYIRPRRSGGFYFDADDSSTYLWVVFSRAEVEAVYGEVTADNAEHFASRLTGWCGSYGGPGRAFSDDPSIRVYKRNIIIKQHRGLDI